MSLLHIAEDIVPISDFKAHVSEVVGGLRQRGRPLVITQNGRPAAVLMSPEAFDALTYHSQFVAAVKEGLAESEAGRLVSDEELRRELEREFGPLGK
jgi:antitoxin YefM